MKGVVVQFGKRGWNGGEDFHGLILVIQEPLELVEHGLAEPFVSEPGHFSVSQAWSGGRGRRKAASIWADPKILYYLDKLSFSVVKSFPNQKVLMQLTLRVELRGLHNWNRHRRWPHSKHCEEQKRDI
jgi:hypothetical protein